MTDCVHAHMFLSKVFKVWLGYWLLIVKCGGKNDFKTELLIKRESTT